MFSIFKSKTKTSFEDLAPELEKLKKEFISIINTEDPLDKAVKVYSVMSSFEENNSDALDDAINHLKKKKDLPSKDNLKELEVIQAGLNKFGKRNRRDKFDTNRAEENETVTKHNIFYGGIEGLFTHSVHVWQNKKDKEAVKIIEKQASADTAEHTVILRSLQHLDLN